MDLTWRRRALSLSSRHACNLCRYPAVLWQAGEPAPPISWSKNPEPIIFPGLYNSSTSPSEITGSRCGSERFDHRPLERAAVGSGVSHSPRRARHYHHLTILTGRDQRQEETAEGDCSDKQAIFASQRQQLFAHLLFHTRGNIKNKRNIHCSSSRTFRELAREPEDDNKPRRDRGHAELHSDPHSA